MRRASTVAALLCLLALTALVSSAPGGAQPAPPPTAAQVEAIAVGHLADVRASLGLSSLDIADVAVSNVVLSSDGGVNTVHLVQRVGGVEIQGATMSIVVSDAGDVLDVGNRFVPGGVKLTRNLSPAIDATEAAERAAVALGLAAGGDFAVQSSEGGPDQEQKLEDLLNSGVDGIAVSPIDGENMVPLLNRIAAKIIAPPPPPPTPDKPKSGKPEIPPEILGVLSEFEEHRLRENIRRGRGIYRVDVELDGQWAAVLRRRTDRAEPVVPREHAPGRAVVDRMGDLRLEHERRAGLGHLDDTGAREGTLAPEPDRRVVCGPREP